MDTAIALSWTLGIILGLMTLLFILRIVLTWNPQVDLNSFPFNIIAWPTEPFLIPVRQLGGNLYAAAGNSSRSTGFNYHGLKIII